MSAAGTAITNFMFRLIHLAFFVVLLLGDVRPALQPPRTRLRRTLPPLLLPRRPRRRLPRRLPHPRLRPGTRTQGPHVPPKASPPSAASLAGLVAIAPFVAAAGLAVRSLPTINAQNGPLVRELATTLVRLPAGPKTLISDDNVLLMLAMGLLTERGPAQGCHPHPHLSSHATSTSGTTNALRTPAGPPSPRNVSATPSATTSSSSKSSPSVTPTTSSTSTPASAYYFEPLPPWSPPTPSTPYAFQTTNTFRLPPSPTTSSRRFTASGTVREQ
jgi:hypothetical protein